MEHKLAESSRIYSTAFEPDANSDTGTLEIRFWRGYGANRVPGPLYGYAPWTAAKHVEFMAAESLGKFFEANIKGAPDIRYWKIDEAPAAPGGEK